MQNNIFFKPIEANPIKHGSSVTLSAPGVTGAEKVDATYTHDQEGVYSTPSTGVLADKYGHRFDQEVDRFFEISIAAGSTGTISAVSNKQIEVSQYHFLTDAASKVSMLSNSTYLISGMNFGAQAGIAQSNKDGLLSTNLGEALNIVSESGSINGSLTYRYV